MIIGGLKQKIGGVKRNGYSKILIPKSNESDLALIDKSLLSDVIVEKVDNLEEVVKII